MKNIIISLFLFIGILFLSLSYSFAANTSVIPTNVSGNNNSIVPTNTSTSNTIINTNTLNSNTIVRNLSKREEALLYDNLNIVIGNLTKTESGRKTLIKLKAYIPTLSNTKLKRFASILKKIDLSNIKYSKNRDVLSYFKYKVLVELNKR